MFICGENCCKSEKCVTNVTQTQRKNVVMDAGMTCELVERRIPESQKSFHWQQVMTGKIEMAFSP